MEIKALVFLLQVIQRVIPECEVDVESESVTIYPTYPTNLNQARQLEEEITSRTGHNDIWVMVKE